MAKYDPLFHYLATADTEAVEMTFAEIDMLVGGLPESARRHAAWWSNDIEGRHVQAARLERSHGRFRWGEAVVAA